MTTEKHLLAMDNEINLARFFPSKIILPKYIDFKYVCFDDNPSREHFKKLSNGTIPVTYDQTLQRLGFDYVLDDNKEHIRLGIDLKVNNIKYPRGCFELYERNGKLTYDKDKDKHFIASVVGGHNIYIFNCSMLEDIVNHTANTDYLPKDFYTNTNYFEDMTIKMRYCKPNKRYFCINPLPLAPYQNYYNAFECSNIPLAKYITSNPSGLYDSQTYQYINFS